MTVDGDDGHGRADPPGPEQPAGGTPDGEQQLAEPSAVEQPTRGEPSDGQSTAGEPTDGRSTAGEASDGRSTVTASSGGTRTAATDEREATTGLEHAAPDVDDRFDWRGWLLVAVVAVAFLVVPGVILLRPVRLVGFRTTYLLLPLLPAVVLGATAVWVALRSREGER